MELIQTDDKGKKYVSWLNQLENNYDNPPFFSKIVQIVKDKIHSGNYNHNELLNVWKKLSYGLNDTDKKVACEANIRCLIDNKIEFLNYHHDNEAMINLLKYSDFKLFKDLLFTFRKLEKIIGFHNQHEVIFSAIQEINDNCPVMNCLELLFASKNKEELTNYRNKMEFLLYLLKQNFNRKFQFEIRYLSNGIIYYTIPLVHAIINKNQLMTQYIESKGGKIHFVFNDRHTLHKYTERSYFNFTKDSLDHAYLLDYLEYTFPKQYKLVEEYQNDNDELRKTRNKKGILQRRKNNNRSRKYTTPSVSLNNSDVVNLNEPMNIENVRERIHFNKLKRNLILTPLSKTNKLKIGRWSNFNSNSSDSSNENSSYSKSPEKVNNPYVVVGGVGGSGTRMIASIIASLGLNIGSDLNDAYDNLSYTLLFKYKKALQYTNFVNDPYYSDMFNLLKNATIGIPFHLSLDDENILHDLTQRGRPGHTLQWLKERAENIRKISDTGALDNMYLKQIPVLSKQPLKGKWGWKEPNSIMQMDILNQQSKDIKFILVVRNGLDMAFSSNQNQLRLWGPEILDKQYYKLDNHGHIIYNPSVALKYWVQIHTRILKIAKNYGKNFLMINYDDMCVNKEKWLKILCDFLGVDSSLIPELVSQVDNPGGIGRFKKENISIFERSDVEYVKKLGFDTEKESIPITKKNNSNRKTTRKLKSVRFNNYVQYQRDYPYVVVGAVGGSGTRLIASMLHVLGMDIGVNLNESLDNNVFVYLFRRTDIIKEKNDIFDSCLDIMRKSFKGRSELTPKEENIMNELSQKPRQMLTLKWLQDQSSVIRNMIMNTPDSVFKTKSKRILYDVTKSKEILEKAKKDMPLKNKPLLGKWGWKAPNSHTVMLRLHKAYSKMKYVMVIRNGLDMAFSDNKNQLELWGPVLFTPEEMSDPKWAESPRLALKYWCISHRRIFEDAKRMGKQFFLIDYDTLCNNKKEEITRFLKFLDIPYDEEMVEILSSYIKPSEGIGRYKGKDLSIFDPADLDYMKSLGYEV